MQDHRQFLGRDLGFCFLFSSGLGSKPLYRPVVSFVFVTARIMCSKPMALLEYFFDVRSQMHE